MPVVGYVPGAYDAFHVGHLNILLQARERCDELIVGVVTRARMEAVKGKTPMVPLSERMEIVGALSFVDRVVVDDSVSKAEMWERLHFDVLFKGDDWQGTTKGRELEAAMQRVGARVEYFKYTPHTSSSKIRARIAENHPEVELKRVGDVSAENSG